MASLELHLRQAVERGVGSNGPDDRGQAILAAIRRALAHVRAAHGLAAAPTPNGEDGEIDWARVDVDELADVYERLLEHGPTTEHARKRSGTYYTPPELVERLLDETLEPVLDRACSAPDPAAALLELRICDPACGSGRFLLAAARRIAGRLQALDGRSALAAVIERCIYGVDVDPIAIELCRLNLAIAAGARLGGDRLRCGDALLGAAAERAPSWAEADAWCAAIVWPAHAPDPSAALDPERAQALIAAYRFFHWSLAYPEVFAAGGFDVVVGNPPWEVLERSSDDERAAAMRGGAQRLLAASGRFPIAAAARKSLYALFAELGDALIGAGGRLGLVVPTELCQGAVAERLVRPWLEQRRCAAVFDFQNRPPNAERSKKWFPAVHPQLRFAIVCLAPNSDAVTLCADASSIADTRDPFRVYRHDAAALLRSCGASFRLPLVRGPLDRRIHERAYARGRPLAELLAEPGVVARLMFNFGADEKRLKVGTPGPDTLRVFEGEHIHQFNHRYATRSGDRTIRVGPEQLHDPEHAIATCDNLPAEYVYARLRALLGERPLPEFLLVLRRQARAADAHVGIAAIVPAAAVEGSLTCFLGPAPTLAILCASFNSYAFNYLLAGRQTGPNVNRGLLAELPIVDRRIAAHPRFDPAWFCARVVELSFTNAELEPFARACGRPGPPFGWSEPRRFELRCELEAALFHLYGFGIDEAARALDRFTIVARRERADHGEFRTKRRILELLR